MEEKQGREDLKLIKEKEDGTEKYLLKKNKITLIAIGITVFFLVVILIALVISGESFI
jgi:hypothetical protein